FFSCPVHRRPLHSFPTRRSSDLVPVCSQVAAMVSVNDVADRPARALADGEVLKLGRHELRWVDAPHVPHGWENGFMMELSTRTRSEEHTSELQSRENLVCRLLLE